MSGIFMFCRLKNIYKLFHGHFQTPRGRKVCRRNRDGRGERAAAPARPRFCARHAAGHIQRRALRRHRSYRFAGLYAGAAAERVRFIDSQEKALNR